MTIYLTGKFDSNCNIDAIIDRFKAALADSDRTAEDVAKTQLEKIGQPAMERLLSIALDDNVEQSFRKVIIHFLLTEVKAESAAQPLFEKFVKGKDFKYLLQHDAEACGLYRETKAALESTGHTFG